MNYELAVETFQDQNAVRLRLSDKDGIQKAYQEINMNDHPASFWEGLFDTRRHVDRYEGSLKWEGVEQPEIADDILKRLGVFLGNDVLGKEIFGKLTATSQNRTLLVKLPSAGNDILAAAFARVPWEIARSALNESSLMKSNLVVRVVTDDTAMRDQAVADVAAKVASGQEPLRVLLVFAEAPGARPLAMRLERQDILNLFYKEILPKKQVKIDVLCYGVTRETLIEQIRSANGYHIVHWSGHGYHNYLKLRTKNNKPDYISGEDWVKLFKDAEVFVPQIVFLSACFSGMFMNVKNWASFYAQLTGKKPDHQKTPAPVLSDILKKSPGYTGTALELLRCGVPQVIAMRYEVGDDYARQLAWWFYKRLLADTEKQLTETALALARSDLLNNPKLAAQIEAVDHATPLMFGQPGRPLEPFSKCSEQLKSLRPQPQPLLPAGSRELESHNIFVGRSEELTKLNTEWLLKGNPAVALIQGLAGMGKTALAAEIIHLWHGRFDYVFAFQAKPTPLTIDDFYRQMDSRLPLVSPSYLEKSESSPFSRIYLEPSQRMTGNARYEQMRINLIEALRDEAILIVLDNFETNLSKITHPFVPSQEGNKKVPSSEGIQGWVSCADPQWDNLLKALCQELPDTRSRLLMTNRHIPACLQNKALRIALGALPIGEAGLYVRSHPKLRELLFSDEEGKGLIDGLLRISRGHPLIMNRLAALADNRAALTQAIESLQNKGWRSLPDLFAPLSEKDREEERKYLNDAAIGSVDFLIEKLSPVARFLLWIITQANEPVTEGLIQSIFAEDVAPLLEELGSTGLISEENKDSSDSAAYSFHELVRERMSEWMKTRESEKRGLTEEQIWVAYGEWYAAMFNQLQTAGQENSRTAASEAGRRALTYIVRAKAFEKMDDFVSGLVTGTQDPILLRGVIAELQSVAEQVPAGRDRWSLRTYLADALRRSGRPDQSLAFYEQAVAEAEAAENWSDVGWICMNWAIALRNVGQLNMAKATQLRSTDAKRKAGGAKVNIIGSELEAFRIAVYQRKAQEVLPDIEARLNEVRSWWQCHKAGESVPDVPDLINLGRALVSGLDIAKEANLQLENWEACLSLLNEKEQAEREMGESKYEQYYTRFNQYFPLKKLGRLDEAQQVVEECLSVYREANVLTTQARSLSALADIWNERGDIEQAIALERQSLSIKNQLPDPSDRAISHGNLSICLNKAGKVEDEARHVLASIIYHLIATRHDLLSIELNNLRNRIRRAAQSGTRYDMPRVSELLARPEFEALGRFVEQFGVDAAELQGAVDEVVEKARQ